MTATAAQRIADETGLPVAYVEGFVQSYTEHVLRPAVERFGDVETAAVALAALHASGGAR